MASAGSASGRKTPLHWWNGSAVLREAAGDLRAAVPVLSQDEHWSRLRVEPGGRQVAFDRPAAWAGHAIWVATQESGAQDGQNGQEQRYWLAAEAMLMTVQAVDWREQAMRREAPEIAELLAVAAEMADEEAAAAAVREARA